MIRINWKPFFFYLGLSLIIFLPLLGPGYINTFDLSWTPHLPLPNSVDNSYPYNITVHFLSLLVPSQILEKLILFGILFSSGLGAHFLVNYLQKEKGDWTPYFAGILYTINPFTYDRFLDGQYLVLAGYALLPWFTLVLFKFLTNPNLKSTLYIVLLACLVSIFSLHSILFIFLITLVGSAVFIWQRRERPYLTSLGKYVALATAAFLVLNSYWLIPFARGTTATSQQIATFDQRELYTFQTVADHTYGIPALFNPLTLYGYWGEDQQRFALPKTHMPVWGLIFLLIFSLTIGGSITYWKKDRGTVIIFGSLIIIGWILAVGIADWPFSIINDWLLNHVGILRGYREPQKFIGLIALGYAVLGALGFGVILEKTNSWMDDTLRTMRGILIVLTLFLPVLYTPTMILGFGGQLRTADFPPDWYSVNIQLNKDQTKFQVLFLPWHHYMLFHFAGRVVSNPAPNFFDKPTIASTSDELGLIPNTMPTPTQNETLQLTHNHHNVASQLKSLGFKYVILAKEVDYQDYSWIDLVPNLKLIGESASLKIYQNLSF